MPQINNPVIHKYKLAFFCIPKCANSSVKQSLRIALKPDPYAKVSKKNLRKVIRQTGEPFEYKNKYAISEYDYLTICIVRNPYERTISTWMHKITHNPKGSPQWAGLGFWAGMSFEDYVKHINKISDEKADVHFKSQSSIIAIDNKIVPRYVFGFEDLPECWTKIQYLVYSWCGLELPDMPHYNASNGGRPNLDEMPKIKNLILRRYKDDFDLLGYKK